MNRRGPRRPPPRPPPRTRLRRRSRRSDTDDVARALSRCSVNSIESGHEAPFRSLPPRKSVARAKPALEAEHRTVGDWPRASCPITPTPRSAAFLPRSLWEAAPARRPPRRGSQWCRSRDRSGAVSLTAPPSPEHSRVGGGARARASSAPREGRPAPQGRPPRGGSGVDDTPRGARPSAESCVILTSSSWARARLVARPRMTWPRAGSRFFCWIGISSLG